MEIPPVLAALLGLLALCVMVIYNNTTPSGAEPRPNLLGSTSMNAAKSCDSFKNPDSCDAAPGCVWCVSYAIPSKCYKVEDAANLPESVFVCDAKKQEQPTEESRKRTVTFSGLRIHERDDEDALCDKKVKQISGYFQIGDLDQHYFFWFFESRNDAGKDPLTMWLTGGPGCSSTLALFAENGPCSVNEDGASTRNNPHSWNSKSNLLYVDQPGGTGFSYGSNRDAARNEDQVAEDLYLFLQAFLTKYGKYAKSKFFLFGESYAGHYVPATAHRIWRGNKEAAAAQKQQLLRINLQGVSVGNGMTNPLVQFPHFPQMAYNSTFAPGLISQQEFTRMQRKVPVCVKLIELCNLVGGFPCVSALEYCQTALISPISDLGYNLYDMRLKCDKAPLCYDFSHIGIFLNRADVRAKLGVPDFVKPWAECDASVSFRFRRDWMHSFHMKLPELLEDGIPVLIYAGDQDYICNWIGNKAWVVDLPWARQHEFAMAKDLDWNSGAGRVRRAGPFSFLQVHQAGHMVPLDQPEAALKMLNDFIGKKGSWKSALGEQEEEEEKPVVVLSM